MDKGHAEEGLKQYPWLRDFCSYLDKEQTDWLDYYLIHAEAAWIHKLASWKMESVCPEIESLYKSNLNDWNCGDDVPSSLKIELFHVFDHLSGGSHDFINRFKEWYTNNYHVTSNQRHNPLGKKILNEYRLAFLEYHSIHENITRTPEMDYMFDIANAVSAEHGFDAPIEEEIMCRALEFAHNHNLRIVIIPNKEDVIAGKELGCHFHPEFKEIRDKAIEAIKNYPLNSRVELIDYNDNTCIFEVYNSTDSIKTDVPDNIIRISIN